MELFPHLDICKVVIGGHDIEEDSERVAKRASAGTLIHLATISKASSVNTLIVIPEISKRAEEAIQDEESTNLGLEIDAIAKDDRL